MPNENEREYKTLVTTIGKNKIAFAVQGGGIVNITQAAVGNGGGTYYVPASDMTELRGEVWRGDIAGKWINASSANIVDVKVVLPADVGGFTVRETALFDDKGDMIAVCNVPDTEKAVLTNGTAGTLTIVMHIILTDVDVVEFKIDPRLDVMTEDEMKRILASAFEEHNADWNAHKNRRFVVAERIRDPDKYDYGIGGGEGKIVVLDTGPLTGKTELSVVVSGSEYDANNLSSKKETAASGSLIIRPMEE